MASNFSDPHPIQIEHCGDRTSDVRLALSAVNRIANHAARMTGAGVQIRAFNAMFKTNKYQVPVERYLWSIYNYRASRDLQPSPYQPSLPRFACATPDSREIYSDLLLHFDPWQRCHDTYGQAFPRAFYAEGTVYTFICPAFFQLSVEPPKKGLAPTGRNCPRVQGNRFLGDVHAFYLDYQVYTLFNAMIRLYLGTLSLGDSSIPRESFDWNVCLRFKGYTSIRNPTNYGLYAARE